MTYMLPTTLAFFLATQMSLTTPAKPLAPPPAPVKTEKAPTRETCWADGQQFDAATVSCVPVTLSAFCREHNWDYEQEQTVSRILNDLNAHDCEEAESILQRTHKLTLRSSGALKVQDLRPLRAMPFLESINLDGQRVNDLSPLRRVVKLRHLSLRNNDVYDLEPLLSLKHLETLDLTGNAVTADDPILKRLQKRVKVVLQPTPAETIETGDGTGLVED